MNELQMIKIVENFSRKIEPIDGQVKVMRVADYKTVYVEKIGTMERTVIFKEYLVDDKTYWAGFSLYSNTVFISQASRD